MGFGARRVRSLPDGIAQALGEDLGQARVEQKEADVKQMQLFKVGDLCPECGQASFVNEEGCRKCYARAGIASVEVSGTVENARSSERSQ